MLSPVQKQHRKHALEADALEDPFIQCIGPGEPSHEGYEAAPDDLLDADIDGEVVLKAGDAPRGFYSHCRPRLA